MGQASISHSETICPTDVKSLPCPRSGKPVWLSDATESPSLDKKDLSHHTEEETMKMTARYFIVWIAMFVSLTRIGWAQAPVPISPASADSAAVVISGCPTFRWSEVEDAVSYRVAVFALDEISVPHPHGEISLSQTPVLDQAIPDRGLSWTPSADSCLPGGTYMW